MQCDGCGQPRDESMSPEAEGTYASAAVRCHACAEQAKRAKAWHEGAGDSDGLYFRLSRIGAHRAHS